jgi:hypothetical protein
MGSSRAIFSFSSEVNFGFNQLLMSSDMLSLQKLHSIELVVVHPSCDRMLDCSAEAFSKSLPELLVFLFCWTRI